MKDLHGKVALITGGASGIGFATSRRLRAEGATVVIGDIDEVAGKAAAEELGADYALLDVSDTGAWDEVVDGITARHGGLDLAFLNAGILTYPATGEKLVERFDIAALPDESYRGIMGANVDGVIFGTRAVVPAIAARGGGAVIATASASGVVAFPFDPIYTTTKHAVVGFVRSLYPSLVEQGITLNAILPDVSDTTILGNGFADMARELSIPLIPAEQIADAVMKVVTGASTGKLWMCLAGREPFPYEFNPVEGLCMPPEIEG